MAEYGEDMAGHVLGRSQFADVNPTFSHYLCIYSSLLRAASSFVAISDDGHLGRTVLDRK
jgi:hypothetical protein